MNSAHHQQAVQEAVKPKFRGKETLNSKVKPTYPMNCEREYKRIADAYMAIIMEEVDKALPDMMTEYRRERLNEVRYDDMQDVKDFVRNKLQKIAEKLEKKLGKFNLLKKLGSVARITRDKNKREWMRIIQRTFGMNLFEDYYNGDFYRESVERWVADNVNQIKSIPTQSLGDMQEIILDGFTKGLSTKEIQKTIRETYRVSKRKAELLARDQIATLNSQLTQLQQRDAGVKRYKWSTSRDVRVRECHRALDGKIFSWDDPPEMWYRTKKGVVYTGRKCHPGEDYCCRCVALPVFDLQSLDIPVKGRAGNGERGKN